MLLEPITADRPCGENLEDTPLLASFDTFRLFGQATPPDARPDPGDREGKRLLPPPEWGEIKSQALEALAQEQGPPSAGPPGHGVAEDRRVAGVCRDAHGRVAVARDLLGRHLSPGR